MGKRSRRDRALDLVGQCADREIQGETLSAARLTDEEGEELLGLARRRLVAESLNGEETARFEALAGKAAGDENVFERRRAEHAEAAKLDALRAAERRHPQAENLVAAVLGDPFLFDGLARRLRPDGKVTDEFGVERQGVTAAVVFDYANVSALHVILSLIVANGGNRITVKEHGVLGDGLPNLPHGALAQLRRNQYITTTQDGTGTRVGLGSRVRSIAVRWGIDVPPDPTVEGDA